MKKNLVKVMVAAMAFAAALAMTSCANPAGSTPANTPAGGDSKVAYGLTALDGWGFYDVSEKTDTTARVSYTGKQPTQYATCAGADITTGANTSATFKVKNNGSEAAYVKIDIKNGTTDTSAVTAATIDGTAADVQWGGADTTIAAGEEKVFVLTLDVSKAANKLIVGLNNNEAENKSAGDISISEAYMSK